MERSKILEVLMAEGNLALEAGNYKLAEVKFMAASEMGEVAAIFNLGILERENGNTIRSIFYFLDAALQGDPEAHIEIGRIYSALGEVEKAKSWFAKAEALGSESAWMELHELDNDEDWLHHERDDWDDEEDEDEGEGDEPPIKR